MRCARSAAATAMLALLAAGQSDVWAPLRPLEGEWEGVSEGKPGKGKSTRRYSFEMNGRFLMSRTVAVYEKETHEDRGVFSFDRAAKTFVLRQFHVEGFINEYTLVASDAKTLVFETRAIENIPAGWRAREKYLLLAPGEMVEEFSLAAPGKDFELYSATRLKRVK